MTYIMNGSACSTKELLIREAMERKLVREDCGLNWDAFEEALIDTVVENLRVKCVIVNAHHLFLDDGMSACDVLLDILLGAASKAQCEVADRSVVFIWEFWTPAGEPVTRCRTLQSKSSFIYGSNLPFSLEGSE